MLGESARLRKFVFAFSNMPFRSKITCPTNAYISDDKDTEGNQSGRDSGDDSESQTPRNRRKPRVLFSQVLINCKDAGSLIKHF